MRKLLIRGKPGITTTEDGAANELVWHPEEQAYHLCEVAQSHEWVNPADRVTAARHLELRALTNEKHLRERADLMRKADGFVYGANGTAGPVVYPVLDDERALMRAGQGDRPLHTIG